MVHTGKSNLCEYEGIPHLVNDIIHITCYPDSLIQVDIIQIHLETDKITDYITSSMGNLCVVI